ncbi:MAG: PEP-utilizing enzyme [Actinomycetota bacterium]
MPDELVAVGDGRYISSPANERFPVWTRGNAGEVYPEVFSPLSWSVASDAGEAAMRRAVLRTGLMTEADFAGQEYTFTAVFGGYAYLNLSVQRTIAHRMIGAKVDDVDQTYLGNADVVPPYRSHPADRNLRASLRGLRHTLRVLRATDVPELRDDQREVERWRASLPTPAEASDQQLRRLSQDFLPMFERMFETHLFVSGAVAIPVGALANLCERRLGDRSLHIVLLGGIGDVESAAPSWALWELGRLVAADATLTGAFDDGVDGLLDRLRGEAAATPFLAAFDDFLVEHGCRGPNEWETACHTWGTQPELALALVDRLRMADEPQAPAVQHARLAQEREAATADAEARIGWLRRRNFRQTLAAAQLWSQARERSKTTVIRAIHELRLASHELGRRCAERAGGDAQPDDLWFLLEPEMDDYIADPAGFSSLIAERRQMRDQLAEVEPPFFFEGDQPSPSTWRRRDRTTEQLGAGAVVEGIGGCPGTASGRARVVTDPSDPTALRPGDVLIAPITDPSWTPLFVPASAVVVDVGAELSHAVIVSRELGIPCVVSATEATRRIPDGALVEVDGTRGEVRVVEV